MQKHEQTSVNILDLDAMTLAEMIATGKLTSRHAVETYMHQIEEMNPTVNCVVENRFIKALREADEADRCIREGNVKGRLFGVPISMKESFHVKGMQTTGGLKRRKGFIQDEDATVVKKLKDEGAILLGKTNTPELCFCQETDNKLYGRTNNPRDLTRTVGGSSGGEAAMIAIGGAAAGIGSDIGGSIRFPSHFNGVIGFKSGKFQVSSTGSYPPEHFELQKRMLGIGPITKSVKDAQMLYEIIAEQSPSKKDLSRFTINVLPLTEFPLSKTSSDVVDSIYKMSHEIVTTEREIPPFFKQSALLWQEIMSLDGGKGTGKEAFGTQASRPYYAYITEKLSGKSDIHRYLSWALIGTRLFKPSKKRVLEIENLIAHGDEILTDYLNKRILVLPVYHTSAPKHGVVYSELFSIRKTFLKYIPYVAYANVWGLPALTIPVGKADNGMPISIQLISANGNEDALFQLGQKLEEQSLGYIRANTESPI